MLAVLMAWLLGQDPGTGALPPEVVAAAPPTVSSPALAAALPELAAMPGIVLVGYPVSGGNPRNIRASINRSRPRVAGQEPFDGMTVWSYSTRWRGSSEGGCDPTTAEVTVNVVITLPELTNRQALSRSERENWDRYLSRLGAHEQNHARIALAGIDQLRTFMSGAPNCETMLAARAQIDAAIRDANRQYDETTRHGATEGARYP